MKPVRKVRNCGSGRIIGRFPTRKASMPLWWESQLERDCLYLFNADQAITQIAAQPFRICYALDGKRRKYVPDFLVVGPNRNDVVEVKPYLRTVTPDFARWKCAVTSVLAKEGYQFSVFTEREIRREPYLSNLKLLHKFEWTDVDPVNRLRLIRLIEADAPTIRDALDAADRNGIPREALWHLLATRVVAVDLTKPLSDEARLTIQKD